MSPDVLLGICLSLIMLVYLSTGVYRVWDANYRKDKDQFGRYAIARKPKELQYSIYKVLEPTEDMTLDCIEYQDIILGYINYSTGSSFMAGSNEIIKTLGIFNEI